MLPGKKGRKVPLIIPEALKMAMECLVSKRDKCGIPDTNPYFFSTRTECGYLLSWNAMHEQVTSADVDVKHPQLITSTRLRKYNATVCQVILNSSDLTDILSYYYLHFCLK